MEEKCEFCGSADVDSFDQEWDAILCRPCSVRERRMVEAEAERVTKIGFVAWVAEVFGGEAMV